MKIIFSIILTFCFCFISFSQETYTASKGPRFFPGHLHIVISVDSAEIHYQLFNHWYTRSYAQYRDLKIPINELDSYDEKNDTLTILILHNKIKLVDKRNKINKKVKHQKLCASVDTMRKISYANSVAEKHEDMMHFHLYDHDDLKLKEDEFIKCINKNAEKEILKQQTNGN